MPKPIFVVGANRSGTKWISNLLSNHSEISSVRRPGAGGILETNFFQQYPKFFNLKDQESRTAFEILYHQSNFFKINNVKLDSIAIEQETNIYMLFNKIMDEFAVKNDTEFWLQKAGSFVLEDLVYNYPDAKFVIIQRKKIFQNVISNILLYDTKIRIRAVLKFLFVYRYSQKMENKFKAHSNFIYVTFEDLKNDKVSVVNKICEHVGIEYEKGMEFSDYKPNTSFKKFRKEDYYTRVNKLKVYSLAAFVKLIPLPILRFVYQIHLMLTFRRKVSFMPSSFSLYRGEKK